MSEKTDALTLITKECEAWSGWKEFNQSDKDDAEDGYWKVYNLGHSHGIIESNKDIVKLRDLLDLMARALDNVHRSEEVDTVLTHYNDLKVSFLK